MPEEDDLIDLEHAGWRALSSGGEVATRFFGEVMATEVAMLLPGGLVITDREEAIRSMGGAAWDAFELSDERVHALTDACAVVTYRASARRGDQDYDALFSSTYVRDGSRWLLAIHQQTPA
jgi:Domain of unknown function (DUF4440)